MGRDTLDAMQLACRFLLAFIQDREAKELPLRQPSGYGTPSNLASGTLFFFSHPFGVALIGFSYREAKHENRFFTCFGRLHGE